MTKKFTKWTVLTLIIFLCFDLSAQELVQVVDEIITVNSTTSMTGYTRNKTSIMLPPKTKGYIYRISIFPKGNAGVDNSLFDLLQQFGTANISIGSSLAQFAIRNNDGRAVDAFIFNNTYDADNFYSKNDGNWSYCKSMPNRVNCCFSTKECIGQEVYFGFRNNNIMQGLDVKLEIVAIVDDTQNIDYKYSYSINNATNQELSYLISYDNINWEKNTLRNGYKQTFTVEQREIFFKIYSENDQFVHYKLTPNERYKIIWSTEKGKWDITRY